MKNNLKIAYYSPKYFSDVDFSLLQELSKLVDIDYFVPVSKLSYKGAAFNLQKPFLKNGIFHATDIYPELNVYSHLIAPEHFFVVNSNAKRMWQPQNMWLYIRLVWQLRKYDVIHITDFPKYHEIPLYFLRKKIVLTVHDPIPHSTNQCTTPMVMKARQWGFRLLRHFIILNKAQKEECITQNHLEDKHIYDSLLGRYDYLRMYVQNKERPKDYFLFFGQIASNKGIDCLLEAMKQIHTKHPEIRLIVAGKGEYPFDISDYGDADYIEFRHRFIPDEELAELIQGAYCAICPYKDATQSGVVMSAFAFNLPIIATNVGGLPEQVIHDRYGLVIPPCDSRALADAMIELIAHPDKVQTYSKNIDKDYSAGAKSWKEISQGLVQIYQDIAK